MRTTFAAIILIAAHAVSASGQTVLQFSYEHAWYGETGETVGTRSGERWLADDGRERQDWLLETGERVSEITLPGSNQSFAINHATQTAVRGRARSFVPIPDLARQPAGRHSACPPGRLQSLLETVGLAVRLAAAYVVSGTDRGVLTGRGAAVESASLGIEQRWGAPLHGERIDVPAQGRRPAMRHEQWEYRPPASRAIAPVLVESTTTVMEDGEERVIETLRPTTIQRAPDDDVFAVPDGFGLLDLDRQVSREDLCRGRSTQ